MPTNFPDHHSDSTKTSFQNPWLPTRSVFQALWNLLSLFASIVPARPLSGVNDMPPVTTIKADFSTYEECEGNELCVHATWLGHAVGDICIFLSLLC